MAVVLQQWSRHKAERRTALQKVRTAVQSVGRNRGKSLGRYRGLEPKQGQDLVPRAYRGIERKRVSSSVDS